MIGSKTFEDEFAYGFDDPIAAVTFTRALRISGWLVNVKARPIHGIRLIARNSLWPRQIRRARRKRSRLDIAAAFPDVPDAGASGFLIEIQLRSGRNEVSLQVQDEQKQWRTYFNATIKVLPFDLLEKIGLPNVRDHFIGQFQRRHAARSTPPEAAKSIRQVAEPPEFQTSRVVIYGTLRSNLFIREVGELVAAGFAELGCDAKLLFDRLPEQENNNALQIVLTPHEYYNLFLLEQVPRKTARALSANLVFLCTEQPATGWFEQNLRWGCYARAVADINPLGVDSYRSHGIRAHHLPLGYHELLSYVGEKPRRDTDIVFLGSLTPRREHFFARHTDFFSQRNCHLRFVPLGFAKTELSRSYLPAAERNALLANSKILLNVHYSDQQYFEWHRMLLGLANGCCIVTENCAGYAPLVPNKHFVMVESGALIEACQYYLERPEERARIAADGAEFVRTKLRQAAGCSALLQALECDRNDIVPGGVRSGEPGLPLRALHFDPPPAALPRELRSALSGKRSFWSALRKDLLDASADTSVDEPAKSAFPPEEQERLRQEVAVKRAGYIRRRHEQESRLNVGEQVWTIYENAEFLRAPAPQISVIITLYNYASFIEACIEAIDRSAFDTMERYQCAAAYSILCRFRKSPKHPLGLLSHYDWDPEILVQGPYVDAMAMFRRDTLLELGGYDHTLSEIGWFGWEDYDMWLRFAQNDLPVGFVPNILCLYRQHEASMINTTNLFARELVGLFQKRYHSLADRFAPREKLFGIDRERLTEPTELTGAVS